jgi:hypothetical protein
MRLHRVLALALAAGILLACNFPLFAPEAYQPTEEPTALLFATNTPLVVAPQTFTPLATASPIPTVAATPSVPVVTPNSVNVNCRSGPDVAYDSVSVLVFGSTTQVVGRSTDSAWWYVQDPSNPSDSCWIFSGVVTVAGPTGGIPVQAPPAAIVTKLTSGVTLPTTITCGGPNPVSFKGTLTTNGPTTVKYQWEVTGDKTNTTSPETITFSDAGTQNVPDPGAYNVDCGQYTLTLHVLSPNDTTAGKNFKIAAP